jgi:hypothetical protein
MVRDGPTAIAGPEKEAVMKSTSRVVVAIIFIACFSVTALAGSAERSADFDHPAGGQNAIGRRLEGTWRVTITMRNCQSGTAIAQALGLNAFLSGGSMIAIPPAGGGGVGVWEHVEGPNFKNFVIISRLNADNVPSGTDTITRHIQLSEDGQEFTTTDTFVRADVNGNVILVGCVTGTAVRLQMP